MGDLPSFQRSSSPGEKPNSTARTAAVSQCCWPFHGDVYATKLGNGELVFPEGEEDEGSSPRGKPCPFGSAPTPFSHYAGPRSGDVVVNAITRVPLSPSSLPYHYRHHLPQSPFSPSNPAEHHERHFATEDGDGKEVEVARPMLSSSSFFPHRASQNQTLREKAVQQVHKESHLFLSQARFTTSQGSGVTEHEDRIGNELWRFRRRGFQDCWMAVFFVFIMFIALFACAEEIRSLSLTPGMRRRMEEQWGLCEFDFAGLHVRENIQRYHAASRNNESRKNLPTSWGSGYGEKRGEKWVNTNSSTSSEGKREGSMSHKGKQNLKGSKKNASSALPTEHTIGNEGSSRFYRKIGETVTFRSMEALIVGLDYTLCNRVSGGLGTKIRRKHKSNANSTDEEEPIIDYVDDSAGSGVAMENTKEKGTGTTTASSGSAVEETLGSAFSSGKPSTWLWEDLGLASNSSKALESRKGNTKRRSSSSTLDKNSSSADRGHRSVQKLLDTYPQTWPIYAMEWKPLLIFEIALFSASPLAILILFLVSQFHSHVVPAFVHTSLLCCAFGSFWSVYAYANLVVALGLILVGGAISWWWWVYGSSRNTLAGVLLCFAGQVFRYPSCSSVCGGRKSQKEEAAPWSRGDGSGEFIGNALGTETPFYGPGSHYPPHYSRFFIFSLFASLIHITNFTVVSLALLPPFFRLFDDENALGVMDALYVLLIVLSDYWLLRVTQVVLEYVACGIVMMLYYNGCEDPPPRVPLKEFLFAALTSHLGAVCTHALLLPPVEVLHRILSFCAGTSHVGGESSSVAGVVSSRLHRLFERKCYQHVNPFALLHVILYGCSYDDAAQYTWWLVWQQQQHPLHYLHSQGEQVEDSSLTGTLLPGERKMSPSFDRGTSFASHPSPMGSSHPVYSFFPLCPSPKGVDMLMEVSEEIHYHIENSTVGLTVNVVVWAVSSLVAVGTWMALHLYLQCLRASSSSIASPLLSAYSSTTSALQSQITSTVDSDLRKSEPGVDISSISIAVVVFFSVSTILNYYVLVFHSVWVSLSLCTLENPFGLACSFPVFLRQIFRAIRPFRIQAVIAELQEEVNGEELNCSERHPLPLGGRGGKTAHPLFSDPTSPCHSDLLVVQEPSGFGYGSMQSRDILGTATETKTREKH